MAATAREAGHVALSGISSVRPDRTRNHRCTAVRQRLSGLREATMSITLRLHVEVGIQASPGPHQELAGQNCTIVATDVVSFGASARTDADRLAIRAGLMAMTGATFRAIWAGCEWQDCGDGLIVVIPPDAPTAAVVASLLTMLPAAVERYNSAQRPGAKVQLRVAVHVGPVVADATGLSGDAIIEAARMLDAPPFKEAVAGSTPVMGLIASEFVFDTAIRNGGLLGGRAWTQVLATVKERELTAWYHLAKPDVNALANGSRPRLVSRRPSALLRGPFQGRQQAG